MAGAAAISGIARREDARYTRLEEGGFVKVRLAMGTPGKIVLLVGLLLLLAVLLWQIYFGEIHTDPLFQILYRE